MKFLLLMMLSLNVTAGTWENARNCMNGLAKNSNLNRAESVSICAGK